MPKAISARYISPRIFYTISLTYFILMAMKRLVDRRTCCKGNQHCYQMKRSTMLSRDPFLDNLIKITERILGIVETWYTKIDLQVDPKKTEVIVFTRAAISGIKTSEWEETVGQQRTQSYTRPEVFLKISSRIHYLGHSDDIYNSEQTSILKKICLILQQVLH